MMAKHPLDGVRAKIKRAEKHLSDFHTSYDIFMESQPITLGREINLERKYEKVFYKEIRSTPEELLLQIGDTIHNLRSALDLLACQLVKLNVADHNCADVSFPIADNAQKFDTALGRNILFRQDAIQIFQQLESYKNGQGHTLWQLHRLDIQDKHRLLIVVPIYVVNADINIMPLGVDVPPIKFPPAHGLGIPKVGDVFFVIDESVHALSPTRELNVQGKYTADLMIYETEIMEPKSAGATLNEFVTVVKDVVKRFETIF